MSAEIPEDGPEDAPVPRRQRNPLLAPLLCLAACVVLFPAFTVVYVTYSDAQTAAQVKSYEAQQVAANNHKFCGLVDTIAAPPPPTGAAGTNPSRAFEQILHSKVVELKRGLQC